MTMFGLSWGLQLIDVDPVAKLVAIRLGDGCSTDGAGRAEFADLMEWCCADLAAVRGALDTLAGVGVTWAEEGDGWLTYQLPDASRPGQRLERLPDNRPAWLYIISGRLGLKIGITTSLEKRVEDLRNSTLDDSVVLRWSARDRAPIIRRAERLAHEVLAAKLIRNEWFAVSIDEAATVAEAALRAAQKDST